MADDKKESTGPTRRTARTPRTPKRPARTIDLDAKEVKDGETEAGKEADKKAPAAEAAKTAPEAKSAAKPPAGASAGKDNAKKATDAKKPAGAEKAKNADTAQSATAQPRTSGVELRSFATHLAAGLVGGLVGVVGAGIGIGQLTTGQPDRSAAMQSEISQLQSRLDALQTQVGEQAKSSQTAASSADLGTLASRVDALEKAPPPATDSAELGALASRVDALEKAPPPSDSTELDTLASRVDALEKAPPPASGSAVSDLSERVAKLDKEIGALQSAAASSGDSAAAEALTLRLTALSDEIKQQGEKFDAEIAELKTSAAADGEGASALAAADALKQRTDSLEAEIAKLSTDMRASGPARTTAGDSEQGAALALAFEALRRAVASGDAYSDQLDLLRAYAPDSLDLTAISAYAETGVPRARDLLQELPAVLEKASEAAEKADDETFLDRVVSNAQSIVRIRRIGPEEGDGMSAVLSRIDADMRASDLTGVLREARNLKGPALDAMKPWLAKAESRQAAVTAVDAAERALLVRDEPKPDAAAKR